MWQCLARKDPTCHIVLGGTGLTLAMLQIKPKRIPDPKKPGDKINDYWGPAQNMLTDTAFLPSLKSFDKDHIPEQVIKVIQPYLKLDEFDPQVVKKASKAAYGLCCWVRAMDQYDKVIKVCPALSSYHIIKQFFTYYLPSASLLQCL